MKRLVIGLIIGVGVLSLLGSAKIIKTGTEAELTGEVSFEESLDVASFWDSQAVPEIQDTAVELNEFLTKAGGKLDSLAEEYGRYTMGISGNINYAVHGVGTVSAVNTEKKAGYLEVKLDNYNGSELILVQVGPVIKKTSIRDYLSFLDVNDFADQIEFAQLSKGINTYICDNVISEIDLETAEGRKIDFYGCFTYDEDSELLITPVVMEIQQQKG